jgi:hypothetical protein
MVQHDESSHFVTVNSRVVHTVGPLLERADERTTFLFQDRAKLPKVTREVP